LPFAASASDEVLTADADNEDVTRAWRHRFFVVGVAVGEL
jgi:hypothetical protein